MATITKSIGTSGSRDYSSITAWEADLTNAGIYSSGDDAVGECYADSTFDESFLIDDNSFTRDLDSITLKANSSEKHNGTPDSGVKIVYTGTVSDSVAIWKVNYTTGTYGTNAVAIEDLEFADTTVSSSVNFYAIDLGINCTIMRRCLINNLKHSGHSSKLLKVFGPDSQKPKILNTMVFNCGHDNATSAGMSQGINIANDNDSQINNCTIHNIYTSSSDTYGINGGVAKNTIVTSCGSNFQVTGGASDYNLSDDSTAPGSNSPVKIEQVNTLYVSTTPGSENLHIKSSSPALRKGQNLGTTNGVQYDIDGYDRSSDEFRWDIGADQCNLCSVSDRPNSKFTNHFDLTQEMKHMSLSYF